MTSSPQEDGLDKEIVIILREWALSAGSVLAVINDQIRPPIIIQNRRNKHTFDTYAFTIDLVPLVFEKTCFAGHTFEFK